MVASILNVVNHYSNKCHLLCDLEATKSDADTVVASGILAWLQVYLETCDKHCLNYYYQFYHCSTYIITDVYIIYMWPKRLMHCLLNYRLSRVVYRKPVVYDIK